MPLTVTVSLTSSKCLGFVLWLFQICLFLSPLSSCAAKPRADYFLPSNWDTLSVYLVVQSKRELRVLFSRQWPASRPDANPSAWEASAGIDLLAKALFPGWNTLEAEALTFHIIIFMALWNKQWNTVLCEWIAGGETNLCCK